MSGGWFITGTDTGVGKTRVAERLLRALVRQKLQAVGMKPVASGCRLTAAGRRSEDAERLLAAGNVSAEYAEVNPYAFAPAIAPHLAAHQENLEIGLPRILETFRRLRRRADWIVVEGVGGWKVPLAERLLLTDIVRAMRLPVIVVVGMRLGCLNHALLTAEAIRHDGIPLAGWIANQIDPDMARVEENIAALESRIAAPLLARFPYETPGNENASNFVFPSDAVMRLTQKVD
ncbi:MAG TPA: dethiobiotin synthase [Candidatus Methylomirabilis sp.]|nr:dethiobiotin synthase [Candidatus Methylomirabilis sp.]